MNQETLYHRQLDIIPLAQLQKAKITVIGAGAVGSFTAFTLAKMGIGSLTVYDDDVVTEHNLPNQLFRVSDIGKKKVVALAEIIEDFHGVRIEAIPLKYINQKLSDIVIVTVDSMDTRIAIWEHICYDPSIKLFIDSRMGAEVSRVISINPIDPTEISFYESTLHTSQEALPVRCTEKTVIYTVLGIASFISGKVKKYLTSQAFNRSITMDYRQSVLLHQ